MTNEQLAALIGEGGNDELLPLLWEKMRKLYRKMSCQYAQHFADKCAQCGVTAEDIQQECYFAMLDSIKAYNGRKPEQADFAFTSFCGLSFKNTADKLIGIGHRGTYTDPLKSTTVPLDEPLTDKDGDTDTTRLDLLPDPTAEEPFREIEQADYCRAAREIVRYTLEKDGNPHLWEVIESYYFEGRTLQQIADALRVSIERTRTIKNKALRQLRRCRQLREQYALSGYEHIGVEACQRGGSIVERTAEQQARDRQYNNIVANIEKKNGDGSDD